MHTDADLLSVDEELMRLKDAWGFYGCRRLPDGSIAGVQRLMSTWSLVLGVEADYWRYRFCFKGILLAHRALALVQSENDVPDEWIACRPQVEVIGDNGLPRYPTPEELRQLRRQKGAA